jgi:low temperature requirement protein LtrA
MLFWIPILPLLSRLLLVIRHRAHMGERLSEEELDRDSHREYIAAMAGFSFTALIALILLDASFKASFRLPIYYLLLSFLAYLFALNLQGYKATRLQDEAGTAAMDVGSLCLILSIVVLLVTQVHDGCYSYPLSVMAIGIWLFHHMLHISFEHRFLSTRRRSDGHDERK